MKKRIMFAISTTRGGGAEVHCTRVLEYFHSLNKYDIALLLFSESDGWNAPDGVKVYCVGTRKEASLFSRVMRIRDAIKDFKPDLINAWNPEVMSLPVAFWGRLMGIKVITSRMVAHKSLLKGGVLREYLNLIADLLGNGIISNSPVRIEDSWLFKKIFDLRNNVVIPNGIEPYISPVQISDLVKLVKDDKNFKIVYAGTFRKVKRLGILLEAYFTLRRKGLDISLYICGGYEKNLIHGADVLTKNADLKEGVKFLGFQKNWREIGEFCDLYISASENEGLSNSLLEAMSLGMPIVVTNIPANTYICKHKENSLLFNVDDVNGLVESIESVMNDSELRKRISQNAFEKSKEFTIEKMSKSYLDFFHKYL